MTSNIVPDEFTVTSVNERLDRDGRQELREETELADTTLDRAIESLQNGDYLFKSRDSDDLRQVVYHIGDDPET